MKLETITLANCGGFEQLDIDFEQDVTLIAGVNGVGKSTILHALAVLLSRALPEFTPSRSAPLHFTNDDIYGDKVSLEVSARIQVGGQTINCGVQRLRTAEDKGDRFMLLHHAAATTAQTDFALALGARTLTGELEAGMRETLATLVSLKSTPRPPLAVYFSPKRQLPGQPRSLPEAKPFDPSFAYVRALQDREVELREFMHWFRTQEKLGSDGDPRRLRVLDALRGVVTELVPEFSNLRIQEQPRLGFVVEKRGKPFYLHQLSDGERGLLALVFDLTRRLAIANPDSDNPIAEGVALVLIDEIELHLHPKWQRDVLQRLRDTFKACQFVLTTHSPLVLGEVPARCVRFLELVDGRVGVTVPSEAYGMDANRILQEFMGAPVRNRQVENELKMLFELIDQENFESARAAIVALERKLGEDEPELTRAGSLIRFLEGSE
ncbi:energy-coupling factor transporter ATP-binding protein EcfA2 [Pseudomonas marginalis]|uniref:AAA family ATPase n=1 Tax=Pseudomonas marginalis TaxID=298 RepID=UPI00209DD61E|nr:AAA family ATPase [Pseudomonas marginalis]MCP1509205.1 energy-coupling factor transporter ATP-binding protein EcfA2 [Pseudomonas marginalis]MCP1526710.1 energy-coupling factor transporter ATP-binding protein EcfA2 [Pseudomonas marginalis]MDQ0502029.1 energy-coupling factor transporter ATP-binding protein EcfA2 [Pseudomonas marginalis]